MLRITSGIVTVLGQEVELDNVSFKEEIGYLPGEFGLYPKFTTDETLEFFGSFYKGDIDWDFVDEACELLELDRTRPVGDLSKGNKQKLGIVLTSMKPFKILFLDEPTSGLDPLKHDLGLHGYFRCYASSS